MGLLGVGPDGALLALHRRRAAAFLLVRQVESFSCKSHRTPPASPVGFAFTHCSSLSLERPHGLSPRPYAASRACGSLSLSLARAPDRRSSRPAKREAAPLERGYKREKALKDAISAARARSHSGDNSEATDAIRRRCVIVASTSAVGIPANIAAREIGGRLNGVVALEFTEASDREPRASL